MKSFIYNAGYFLKEVRTIIRLNPVSNIFSFLSTGLIFFILSMVISGWWISTGVIETIQEEAEVSVYFDEKLDKADAEKLTEKINAVPGVREARLVSEAEAYNRMVKILGEEARVLSYFDDNPFSPFIEVKIRMDEIEPIIRELDSMTGIEHVRDNREVLLRLRSIAGMLELSGYLVVAVVGITTVVIISHIIKMGIYDSREQINTLRLLGAPESFIAFPFMLEGLLLTFGGGALAAVLAVSSLKLVYAWMAGPLTFIPLPIFGTLTSRLILLIILFSAASGTAGSLFGLTSAKRG